MEVKICSNGKRWGQTQEEKKKEKDRKSKKQRRDRDDRLKKLKEQYQRENETDRLKRERELSELRRVLKILVLLFLITKIISFWLSLSELRKAKAELDELKKNAANDNDDILPIPKEQLTQLLRSQKEFESV